MAAVQSSWIDEGHISYCEQTGKHYRFDSTNGEKMERWIELLSDENIRKYFTPPTQDIFIVGSVSDLTDDLATGSTKVTGQDGKPTAISLGKLVYVKDNNKFYYNAYDQGKGIQYNDYLENHSGWFHPLISNKDFESYVSNKFIEYGYCTVEVDKDDNSKFIIKSKADTFLTEAVLGTALQTNSYLNSKFDDYASIVNIGSHISLFFDQSAFDTENNKYKFATESDLEEIKTDYLQSSQLDDAISQLGSDSLFKTTYATKDELGLDDVQPSKGEEGYSSVIDYITKTYATIEYLNNEIGNLNLNDLDTRLEASTYLSSTYATKEYVDETFVKKDSDSEGGSGTNDEVTTQISQLQLLVQQLNTTIATLTARVKTLEENAGIVPPKDNLAGEGEYTVASAINLYNTNGGTKVSNVTVCGYIVGAMTKTTGSPEFAIDAIKAGSNSNTNLILADNPNIQDMTQCMVVQLPSGTIRDELNLVNNPANHKKPIKVTGTLESYFSAAGIKSTKSYSFIE
jgi:hypothetical protein